MSYPREAVNKAFAMLPGAMDTLPARIQHAAIGFQESKYKARRQLIIVDGQLAPEGPATSFWQFENGRLAGINGVLNHRATTTIAKEVCRKCGVIPDRFAVWEHMQVDDVLGAAFARLLMWSDSSPVPINEQQGWQMYLRTWRPGKPHPEDWPTSYANALKLVAQ